MTILRKALLIGRSQDTGATPRGDFAGSSRPCPPFGIRPIQAARRTGG